MVQQQLEQLSVIGRCEYQKTCTLLVQLFDQSARVYQELMSSPQQQQLDITIQEGKQFKHLRRATSILLHTINVLAKCFD